MRLSLSALSSTDRGAREEEVNPVTADLPEASQSASTAEFVILNHPVLVLK